MNYQPGYHKTEPGQKCRIFAIQVAVPANVHPDDIADEMTSLLTTAIADEQSNVLDWQYAPGCGPVDSNFATASDEPVEGEIFVNTVAARREQILEKTLLDCLNALKDAATVVDAGDGENYAYQHEIEVAEAVLADDPTAQRPLADSPVPGLGRDMHTPGVWQVDAAEEVVGHHSYPVWCVTAAHRGKTLAICRMMGSERMPYDARLVAAAPHMKVLLNLAYRYLAVMVAENIQTVLPPQAVMCRIDELMAQIEAPIPPWLEERKP